jgi:hypothetical protein
MRALKLVLLILALAPIVWLRQPAAQPVPARSLTFVDLMPALRRAGPLPTIGAPELVGIWHLRGGLPDSGTLSGLAQTDREMVAVGDRGAILRFARPDQPGASTIRMGKLIDLDWRKHRHPTDAEAVVVEPKTGDLLVSYEDAPAILRFSADLANRTRIPVLAFAAWPENQGAEAMARLTDGRTLVIAEGYARWPDRTSHEGLIFPGSPQAGAVPARFMLRMPAGYRPCELAQMPDGRLLVLGRSFSLVGFRSVIAVFAPDALQSGTTITPSVLVQIADSRIRENYEGMTVTREPDGNAAIWLISDSNQMVWAQRTLLLKLRLKP